MSNTYCVVFFFLRLVYPMLPVSLNFSFLIVPSVFSNVNLDTQCSIKEKQKTPPCRESSKVQSKNRRNRGKKGSRSTHIHDP